MKVNNNESSGIVVETTRALLRLGGRQRVAGRTQHLGNTLGDSGPPEPPSSQTYL